MGFGLEDENLSHQPTEFQDGIRISTSEQKKLDESNIPRTNTSKEQKTYSGKGKETKGACQMCF